MEITHKLIEAKAFRTYIRIYPLFKSERLDVIIKFALHKTLIRSIMTYGLPVSEFVSGSHLLKLKRLQSIVLHTIGQFSRRTPVRDLHMAFRLTYIRVYDSITELCRQQAEAIQNHENADVRSTGQGEPRQRKYKTLKLGGSRAYNRSSD
jgi:hypothetical protein